MATLAKKFETPNRLMIETSIVSFGATTKLTNSTTKSRFSLGSSTASNVPSKFSFGSTTTTATESASLFSFGSAFNVKTTVSSTSAPLTLGTATNVTTTAAPVFCGLGGLDTTSKLIQKQSKAIPALEMPIPNVILELINHSKDFLKQHKTMITELARMSPKGFNEIAADIIICQTKLQFLDYNIEKQKTFMKKLKHDSYKCLQDFEIAQCNYDHPAMVQNNMDSTIRYFAELIQLLQEKGNILKNEIENTLQYLATLPYNNNVTVDEFRKICKMYYKNVVTLAGRLHSIHNEVQMLKSRHLSFQTEMLNDHSNSFKKYQNQNSSSFCTACPGITGSDPFFSLNMTVSAALNLNTFGLDQPRLPPN